MSIEQNCFQASCLSADPEIQRTMAAATRAYAEDCCLVGHAYAVLCAVRVLALSAFNIVAFTWSAVRRGVADLIILDFCGLVTHVGEDLYGALSSVLFTAFSVFYVAAGIFFPCLVFPYFTPPPPPEELLVDVDVESVIDEGDTVPSSPSSSSAYSPRVSPLSSSRSPSPSSAGSNTPPSASSSSPLLSNDTAPATSSSAAASAQPTAAQGQIYIANGMQFEPAPQQQTGQQRQQNPLGVSEQNLQTGSSSTMASTSLSASHSSLTASTGSLLSLSLMPATTSAQHSSTTVTSTTTTSTTTAASAASTNGVRKQGVFEKWFVDGNHPSKEHKYRALLNEYVRILTDKEGLNLDLGVEAQKVEGMKELYPELVPLVCQLLEALTGQNQSARAQYAVFVRALRAVVESSDYRGLAAGNKEILAKSDPQGLYLRSLIHDIAYVRWGRAQMFNYLRGITELTVAAEQAGKQQQEMPALSVQTFAAALERVNTQVKNAPTTVKKPVIALQVQKARGTLGLQDFTAGANIPYVRAIATYAGSAQARRQIFHLRHGSPTTAGSLTQVGKGIVARTLGLEGPDSGEGVASDYRAFLCAAAERGERVLYAIHQRRVPDKVDNEADRVAAIEALQRSHPNFHAFVQPVEGELFDRSTEQFQKMTKFETLKVELCVSFGREDGPFSIPLALQGEDKGYLGVLENLFDSVHQIFFNGKQDIADGPEEWQTFILLCYVFQKIDLKFRLGNVAFYVTACKDFLDRGGMMALVEEMVHDYMLNQHNDPDILRERIINAVGAAILVKKKEIIPTRLAPALAVSKYLCAHFAQHHDRLTQLQKYTFGTQQWRAQALTVPKTQGQTAVPTYSEDEGDLKPLLSSMEGDMAGWTAIGDRKDEKKEEKKADFK